MINLKNKKVIITGGSRGIGYAILKEFYENNSDILTIGSNIQNLKKVQSDFPKIKINQLDLKNSEDLKIKFPKLIEELGGIDILVNNAGITKDNLLIRMSENDIDDVINVNLNSLIKITKFALKNMMKNKFGRIISISSVVGFTGNPGQANYCASKSGIIGFTKSLALEVASRGITVNAIAPGFISSAMTDKLTEDQREKIISNIPVNRLGTPKDVANAVIFLAKEDSSYITGNTIHVNGGLAMV